MNLTSVPWNAVKLVTIDGLEIKVLTTNGEKDFQFSSKKEADEQLAQWCVIGEQQKRAGLDLPVTFVGPHNSRNSRPES